MEEIHRLQYLEQRGQGDGGATQVGEDEVAGVAPFL